MGERRPVNDAAMHGFGAEAGSYERARPGYPESAVGWLIDELEIDASSVVVDLAAGTGKFTRSLASTQAAVIAVEPVAAMRERCAAALPAVEVVAATATALPFGDQSVDAITVAQAFHWFDPEEGLAEIGRVVAPGGGLGLVWNQRDVSVPWVAELNRLVRRDRRTRDRLPYPVGVDWGELVDGLPSVFGLATRTEGRLDQPMDADLLVDRVRSTSYLATLSPAEFASIEADVRALVAPLGDRFVLPYVTIACAYRRP